jgi:hypothetical protein
VLAWSHGLKSCLSFSSPVMRDAVVPLLGPAVDAAHVTVGFGIAITVVFLRSVRNDNSWGN